MMRKLCQLGLSVLLVTPGILLAGPSLVEVKAQQSDYISMPKNISGDGSSVVGINLSSLDRNFGRAFKWSAGTGQLELMCPADYNYGEANDTTRDGSVVVGMCAYRDFAVRPAISSRRAYMWNSVGVATYLWDGSADAVSADGNTVIGIMYDAAGVRSSVRWTADNGVEVLTQGGFVYDVSDDGAVVVGRDNAGDPYLWRSGVFTNLAPQTEIDPILGIPNLVANVSAVSGNGMVALGTLHDYVTGESGAALWTAESGWQRFGDSLSDFIDINYDGTVAVGYMINLQTYVYEAAIWDAINSVRLVKAELNKLGVVSDGWELNESVAVSSDGKVIVGTGTNTLDQAAGFGLDAWMADISGEAINNAPVANDDNYSVSEDQVLSVSGINGVLSNDIDIENGILAASLQTTTLNGVLSFYGDGSFVYTPNQNYYGSDSFEYYINDGVSDSNIATVTLSIRSVNDAPIACFQSAEFAINRSDVPFDASCASDDGTIVSYSWDFGDGNQLVGVSSTIVTHQYKKPGSYQVSLIVTDDSGLESLQLGNVEITRKK